ncbi:Transcriptional regulator TetR family [Patulibacter medicamentivorans]|uniref:Transcriptional regulator TetR family n=1 Tax=Patulibacter medicamentivorans TaxID=1097667 RepID=H0E0S4_9ACTN|nr:TetR family transcriptional regulator [Patulibacter medicamentivorans]EHN12688.1 Transcriptional regulator TetR family [Patulibacter medicamentivorans]
MAPNPGRRAVLADAALAVLARDGARGLTHRAVDAEAGAPSGTTSNYFRSRDALLEELGRRIYERLEPDEAALREAAAAPPSHERLVVLVRELVERLQAQSDLYLALFELRLEATRRPAVREALTATIRRGLDSDVGFHQQAGLRGGREEIVLLHLAIDGLMLDRLTLPDALGIEDVGATVRRLVDRLVPDADGPR